jgi:hypothetical protein
MLPEPLQVARRLILVFDALGVAYLVGGSVASSIVGVERSTQDIDFVVALAESHIAPLVAALEVDFYADADLLRAAVEQVSSANVIHLPTMMKADLFVLPDTPFAHSQMERRLQLPVLGPGEPLVCVTSPEDMILQKLLWFRMTGERSEKQWSDVQGIFRIQAGALDQTYLSRWASTLEIADLYQRACIDAG